MIYEIENPDGDANMELQIVDHINTIVHVCTHRGTTQHPPKTLTYVDLSIGDVIEYPTAGGPCRKVAGIRES